MPQRNLGWWLWLATDVALANYLFVDRDFIKAALALALIQVPLFGALRGWRSFPAQVRIAYGGLMIAGLWPPLAFIHWIQRVGTTAMVLFGYCFLARCLSLLPWNRTAPITPALLTATFFSMPVEGSIVSAMNARSSGGA